MYNCLTTSISCSIMYNEQFPVNHLNLEKNIRECYILHTGKNLPYFLDSSILNHVIIRFGYTLYIVQIFLQNLSYDVMIHYNLVYLHQQDIFFSVKFTYRYTVYVRKIYSSLDSPNSIKVIQQRLVFIQIQEDWCMCYAHSFFNRFFIIFWQNYYYLTHILHEISYI